MVIRGLLLLFFATASTSARSEILRCSVKSVIHGSQERLVDIVLPNDGDPTYDVAVIDSQSGAVRKLGTGSIFGKPLHKGLGVIEMRTRTISGEFGKSERFDLVVSLPLDEGFDLMGVYFRSGPSAGFMGNVVVDRGSGRKTITLADAVHVPRVLTFYKGTCE